MDDRVEGTLVTPVNATAIRRGALAAAAMLLAASIVAGLGPPAAVDPQAMPERPRFVGHQPGKVYLGFTSPDPDYEREVERVGEPTVRRGRYLDIGDVEAEIDTMRASLARGRLPWTSYSADWREVARGKWDTVLSQHFAGYRALPGPGLATFAHEPIGKGDPKDFVAAWRHILDLADREGTGSVSLVPVMNGYVWGPWADWSDAQIDAYLPADLLARWPMVGVDVYHGATAASPGATPAEVLGNVVSWADRAGVDLLAIGEIGVHDPDAWTQVWSFIERHRHRFVAVSYYNSHVNVRPGVQWYLSGATLAAFQESLTSPFVARLEPSGSVSPTG